MDPLRNLTGAQRFALARQLRRVASPAERHVLHGFIVDFYCLSERLVLELEGTRTTEGTRGPTTRRARNCWKPLGTA